LETDNTTGTELLTEIFLRIGQLLPADVLER